MSSVKLTHNHQLLVKGFQDVGACYHSVDFLLCVLCVHNVSLYWTTDRQSLCHHWLRPPSGSAIVTSPSTWLVIGLTLCLPGFPGVYATNAPEMFSYTSFF